MQQLVNTERPENRCIKSYVLRSGRMSDAQKRSYENLHSRYCIPVSEKINYENIFGNSNPVIIEIGFGSGSVTAALAAENPAVNYLGIEVFKAGIGKLLWEIEKRNLDNIRIIEGDAAEILPKILPEEMAAGIHVFFPDPWPKKRHHKRRLITRPFTDTLCDCLSQGGYIYMVTDWEDYAGWALKEFSATPGLINQYEGFASPQEWRPGTRFEAKGLNKNHQIRELFFKRENNGR